MKNSTLAWVLGTNSIGCPLTGVGGGQINEAVKRAKAYERQLCIQYGKTYSDEVGAGGTSKSREDELAEPALKYCKVVKMEPNGMYTFAPKDG